MRVLLVGGNGFIGSPLTRELVANRHQVAVLHRPHNDGQPAAVEHILADRNRLSTCNREIQRFGPDVIIDLILSSEEQAVELVKVARQCAPRVIVLSSMDVYRAWGVLRGVEDGPLEPLPITEESPVRSTRRLYSPEAIQKMQEIFAWVNESYDKIAVEEMVMGSPGVSATILRLPMVHGPGDPLLRFLPVWKRISDSRGSIILSEDVARWRAPRGYVDNVAHAIVLALSDGAIGRVYNVCQEPCVTELEWHKKIAEQANWKGKMVVLPREHTPAHLLMPGNYAQHVVTSSERIRKELAYQEIVASEDGIARTLAWHAEAPAKTTGLWQFDYEAEDRALAQQPEPFPR